MGFKEKKITSQTARIRNRILIEKEYTYDEKEYTYEKPRAVVRDIECGLVAAWMSQEAGEKNLERETCEDETDQGNSEPEY